MAGSTAVCSHSGFPGPVPTSTWAGGLNSDQVDQTALPDRKPQGVILVTEHNDRSQCGVCSPAGLQSCSSASGGRLAAHTSSTLANPMSLFFANIKEKLVATYWEVVSTMVSNGRDDRDIGHLQNAKLGSKRGWL